MAMSEKVDFLFEPDDRRKHLRFESSIFAGVPVILSPLPPFFGESIKGKVRNLSAGGIALLIDELIPEKTKLDMELTFPDHSLLKSKVHILHIKAIKKRYLTGIHFVDLPKFMEEKINNMARDFLSCESRIKDKKKDVCLPECTFFSLCNKKEKKNLIEVMDNTLRMKFRKTG